MRQTNEGFEVPPAYLQRDVTPQHLHEDEVAHCSSRKRIQQFPRPLLQLREAYQAKPPFDVANARQNRASQSTHAPAYPSAYCGGPAGRTAQQRRGRSMAGRAEEGGANCSLPAPHADMVGEKHRATRWITQGSVCRWRPSRCVLPASRLALVQTFDAGMLVTYPKKRALRCTNCSSATCPTTAGISMLLYCGCSGTCFEAWPASEHRFM